MGLKELPKLEQEVTAYLGWDTQSSCGARASPDVVGQFPDFGCPCFHQLWGVKSKTNPKGLVKGRRDPDVQFHSPTQHSQGCDRSSFQLPQLPRGMFPNPAGWCHPPQTSLQPLSAGAVCNRDFCDVGDDHLPAVFQWILPVPLSRNTWI